jgi:hypothetical protein
VYVNVPTTYQAQRPNVAMLPTRQQHKRGCGCHHRRRQVTLGAATQIAKSAGISAAAVATTFIPVVGPFIAPFVQLLGAIKNHPYGSCSPNAPDMVSYLACWKHAIPSNYIPHMQGGPRGWGWAWCEGANGGSDGKSWASANQSFMGCKSGCDCTSGKCGCAPAGAVMANPDGTFNDAWGRNLGPVLSSTKGMPMPTDPLTGAATPGGQPGSTPAAGSGGTPGTSIFSSIPLWMWLAGGGVGLYLLLGSEK